MYARTYACTHTCSHAHTETERKRQREREREGEKENKKKREAATRNFYFQYFDLIRPSGSFIWQVRANTEREREIICGEIMHTIQNAELKRRQIFFLSPLPPKKNPLIRVLTLTLPHNNDILRWANDQRKSTLTHSYEVLPLLPRQPSDRICINIYMHTSSPPGSTHSPFQKLRHHTHTHTHTHTLTVTQLFLQYTIRNL